MIKKTLVNLVKKIENLPGENKKPNFCCYSVTDNCTLRCRMCHKWKKDISVKTSDNPPAISQWKQSIQSLREITDEGFLINFGGGEPFLFEEITELVRFAADRGFKTNIATNGYLIDEDMAKRIAQSGLSTVNISLDSVDKATHDYIRGTPGAYTRAIKAVEYLDRYCPGLKKGICCVISELNISGILELYRFIEDDSRLDWIYFMAVVQPNNTEERPGWYKEKEFSFLWPKDARKIRFVIDSLIAVKNKGSKIANKIPQLKAFKSYFLNPTRFIKTAGCNLSRALHISSTGDVFICFQWDRLGNIKSDDLSDLWHSDKTAGIREKVSGCRKNCHFLINCFFEDDLPFSF
jgi:MoaA/NifB/PqqE/SkfB family radical SAM enzyme